ncbi:type I-E CRISPR-associated protein Cse1/CasA [Corynebacterium jeikeium]|uniref:type I-E CRISPR-associated protein Cse1/CasA n=1 Tax=Corynebacterium macclintockiae TaxID=2913501 RepID=UPI00054EBF3F
MTESFSLLDQPWILTMLTDGSTAELSLREIFDGSHSIASIRGDSPVQDAAIYRLLLAMYWCAYREELDLAPSEELDMAEWIPERLEAATENQPDDTVLGYLDRYADRFDLLDAKKPFMQVADLHTSKNATSDVRRIVPDFDDDYFTLRAGDGAISLTFAEAARWLVYIQAYDYSGIKSGAVGDPRVKGGKGFPIGTGWTGAITATIILGSNLPETLALNTTAKVLQAEGDRPVWEREPDTSAQRLDPANKDGIYPKGPAEILTWQSRRIRLFPENGLITQVLVSNGDRIPNANANVKDDPMTPYRYSKNKSKKGLDVYYPKPLDAQRTMWRSLEPLIALETDPVYDEKNRAPERPRTIDQLAYLKENEVDLPETLDVSMSSVQYGSNSSVVDISISTRIELPLELLPKSAVAERQAVLNLAAATSQAGTMLGSFAGQLFQAAGGDYEFQPAATDTLLAELEPKFSEWMKTLQNSDLEPRLKAWEMTVRNAVLQHADVLLVGAGPKALIGRIVETNGDERFVSAGTVMSWLQKKLREILPRTVPR